MELPNFCFFSFFDTFCLMRFTYLDSPSAHSKYNALSETALTFQVCIIILQVQRRLAQNREAARKSRLRKKVTAVAVGIAMLLWPIDST